MAEENIPKIDVSKVKNMKALKAEDPDFASVLKKNFKQKDSKFKFTEPERIPLPSGGRFYQGITDDEDILNGYIFMYPMTAKEEEILVSQRFIKSGISTRMVLENCIASNIDAKDLLIFDSNFLFFYLRQISYGDEYKFGIKCPNCKKTFKHNIKISELNFEEMPKELKEPIDIKLPYTKYTVSLILPRVYHTEVIYQERAKMDEDEEDLKLLSTALATTISIKDKNGIEISQRDWKEFYLAIPGMDRALIQDKTTYDTGIDEIKNINCPLCGDIFNANIPMGVEFFRL